MGNAAAIREDLCPVGDVNRTPEKFFRKNRPDLEAKWADEEDNQEEEFEHLGISVFQLQQQMTRKKSGKSASRSRASRSRASRKASGFDHEASFLDGAGKSDGQHRGAETGTRHRSNSAKSEDLPLLTAIKQGRLKDMKDILRELPSAVHEQDRFQQTPIFWVSGAGDMEALQALLDCNAEVECSNKHGYTPLMRALRHGRVEIAEQLLRHNADLMAQDCHEATALQIAASNGHAAVVEWVLGQAEGLQQVNARDVDGVTAMQAAAQRSHAEVCRLLLEARAQPDCADEVGRTPLLFALARNDVDLASDLIAAKADVNAEDDDGRSVLLSLVENITKHKDKKEIRDATLGGLATALEAKADPDHMNENGSTALLMAVKNDDGLLTTILAAYGADVGYTDEQERTLLVMAKKKGFVDVTKVLQEFGAVKAKTSNANNRLLLRATYYGNQEACSRLIEKGALGNATTKGGKTTATVAREKGVAAICQMLRNATREDAANARSGAAMTDEDVLRAWLQELRESGQRAGRIQGGARDSDSEAVLAAVQDIRTARAPPDRDASISARFLSAFLANRQNMTMRKAQSELRKIRARARRDMLMAMAEGLDEWDRGRSQDRSVLTRIASVNAAAIRSYKVSDFEREDPFSVKLDEFQREELQVPLRLVADLPPVYTEVCTGYEMFPAPHAMDDDDPLQCQKCLATFGTEGACRDHARFCRSNIGKDQQETRARKRLAKAESAIHHLEVCVDLLRKKADLCQDAINAAKKSRRETAKKFPEAVLTLQGVYQMLLSLQRTFLHRAHVCDKHCEEQEKLWGLSRDRVRPKNTHCLRCFVSSVTRAAVHEDARAAPCKCLCTPCAKELSIAVQFGRPADCPECGQPIKDFLTVQGLNAT